MSRTVVIAATQFAASEVAADNLDAAERLVRRAAGLGAQVILLQELFETPYFCKDQKQELFALARPFADNPIIARFAALAAELGVVLPISFFERANAAHYNSLAMIDADGTILGRYRKSHIPDGPGYQEKFYFNPGDTGFQVWDTRFARIGVAVCWDQWFPECARSMTLRGAEMLLYPTAIGSEPQDPSLDSHDHWRRVMQGHAAANLVPVIASNRVGTERGEHGPMTFYGGSFITDARGAIIAEAPGAEPSVITAGVDLARASAERAAWGLFRDRRPDLYAALLTLDGETSE